MLSTKAIMALVAVVVVLLAVIFAVVRHEAAQPAATPAPATTAKQPGANYQKWNDAPVQKGKIKGY